MKKRWISFYLLLVLVLVSSGCNGENNVSGPDRQSTIQKKALINKPGENVWDADPDKTDTAIQAISMDMDKIPKSVSDIKGKERNTEVYLTDMNEDGANEYVITYLVGNSDSMSNMIVFNPQDNMQKEVFNYNDDAVTFTESQKKQISAIIDTWYENNFQDFHDFPREYFEKYNIISFSCYPVKCDAKSMIHVSFQLSEQKMKGSLFVNDTIEVLLKWDGSEYNVYKCWYKGKFNSTRQFGN